MQSSGSDKPKLTPETERDLYMRLNACIRPDVVSKHGTKLPDATDEGLQNVNDALEIAGYLMGSADEPCPSPEEAQVKFPDHWPGQEDDYIR